MRSQRSFHACPVCLSALRQRTSGTPSSSSAAVPSVLPAPVRRGPQSLWEAGAGIPVVDMDGRGQNFTNSMENTAPVQVHAMNTQAALPEPYIIRAHSTQCFVTQCTLLSAFYSVLSNSPLSYSCRCLLTQCFLTQHLLTQCQCFLTQHLTVSVPSFSVLSNSPPSYSVSVPSFSVLSNSAPAYSVSVPSYTVLSNSAPSYSVSVPSYSVLSDSAPSYSVSVPSYSVLTQHLLIQCQCLPAKC